MLTSLTITPDDNKVFASTTWLFAFTLASDLPESSRIKITLPSEVATSGTSCLPLSEVLGLPNGVDACEVEGQNITLSLPSS